MPESVIIAGFGGQGVLFAGQVLAYAGMLSGREVTWLPSYGPQMRGGTANCTVVISDRPVRSPVVRRPRGLIVLNRPSLDAFEPMVQPGGVLVVNRSLVDRAPARDDVTVVSVAASEMAQALGDIRTANMVALGAYVAVSGAVSREAVLLAVGRVVPESRAALRALNTAAFQRGSGVDGNRRPCLSVRDEWERTP